MIPRIGQLLRVSDIQNTHTSRACGILPQHIGTKRNSPSFDGVHKQDNSINFRLLTVMEHCLPTC